MNKEKIIEKAMKLADEYGEAEHGEIYETDSEENGRGTLSFTKADIRDILSEVLK